MGEERVPRREFIRYGAAVGLSVAGASVLASCGGGGDSAQSEESTKKKSSSSGGTTDPTVGSGEPIVLAAFLPPGFAFPFTIAESGKPALLVHLKDDSWAAYEAVCTHKGCEIGYQVDQPLLRCPCHGSGFDPADGAVANGPAQKPLQKVKVKLKGDNVVRA
ncbi:MAG TPA: Rieske (2Fe-2S) protein [Rubrobacteraceae bacterium]|nr:Rieske (2Fe-2S) protein [Rubrobacteraceae bacterium]